MDTHLISIILISSLECLLVTDEISDRAPATKLSAVHSLKPASKKMPRVCV